MAWWGQRRVAEQLVVAELAHAPQEPLVTPDDSEQQPAADSSRQTHFASARGLIYTRKLLGSARAASVSATANLRQLRQWAVGTGPTSVRVLSFFAGLMLCVTAVVCALIGDIFRNFNLLKMIIDGLLFVGGGLVIAMDGPFSPLLPAIRRQFKSLTTVCGRGVYQILIGCLALSQGFQNFSWHDPLADLGALLYVGSALVLLGMGGVFVVAGLGAAKRMTSLREALGSEKALRSAFQAADADKSGALDYTELAQLAGSLGSEMTTRQLEIAIDMIDLDRNGQIDFEEFHAWWTGAARLDLH